MGAAASVQDKPFDSVEAALVAGKTQEEIDQWIADQATATAAAASAEDSADPPAAAAAAAAAETKTSTNSEHPLESVDGSAISGTFEPDGEPVEFETGGEVTRALIFLHGITVPNQVYVEGDGDQQFGRTFEKSEYWSLKHLLANAPGFRVVLPQSPTSNSKAILGVPPFSALGATSIISWVHQNGYPPEACYDFSKGRAPGVVNYVHGLIDKEVARGVKPERIFVAGHSQGACCGAFAALTYANAPLGGLIMLSTANHCINPTDGSCQQEASEIMHDTQKNGPFKILCCHSPQDRAWKYENTVKSYESLKRAVGDNKYTFVEVPDAPADMGWHTALTPTSSEAVAEFLGE